MQHRGAISGWIGMDGMGWSPGGVSYRAPYGANYGAKNAISDGCSTVVL